MNFTFSDKDGRELDVVSVVVRQEGQVHIVLEPAEPAVVAPQPQPDVGNVVIQPQPTNPFTNWLGGTVTICPINKPTTPTTPVNPWFRK